MSDAALDQVVELAFKLSIVEQAKLVELVAAHLASEVKSTQQQSLAASMANHTYEVWSPQDEGGAVAALEQAIASRR